MSKQVRFIRPWSRFRKGDVFAPAAILRNWLVHEGFGEIVVEEPDTDPIKEMQVVDDIEVATVRAPEVAALRTEPVPPKRKRGRPRKIKKVD